MKIGKLSSTKKGKGAGKRRNSSREIWEDGEKGHRNTASQEKRREQYVRWGDGVNIIWEGCTGQ